MTIVFIKTKSMKYTIVCLLTMTSFFSCDPIGQVSYIVDNQSKHDISFIVNDTFSFNVDTILCKSGEEKEVLQINRIGLDCDESWTKNHPATFLPTVSDNTNLKVIKNFKDSSSWSYKLISNTRIGSCSSECRILIEDKDVQ